MEEQIRQELAAILEADTDETLKPQAVLAWASANPESATYQWLEAKGAFDPQKAMAKWGLALCRRLIVRVKVEVMPRDDQPPRRVRAYQSTLEDRRNGLGYRSTESLITHEAGRTALVRMALSDLAALKKRYEVLRELVEVWRAIELAESKATA